MTATTATYSVSKTPLGAEQYRVVIEITGTTNALDLELFVFETSSDAYVSVATRYTLELMPNDKQDAIDDGDPYYRGTTVLRDFRSVESADTFINETIGRISHLCVSLDRAAAPFAGTEVGTAPGEYSPSYPAGGIYDNDSELLSTISIKAGDTLSLPMRWAIDGVPVDLSGYTVTSHVRRRTDDTGGAPLDVLTCVIDPDQITNPGRLVVSATSMQTELWPIAVLVCDVEFVSGLSVIHTDSFEILVQRPVTL